MHYSSHPPRIFHNRITRYLLASSSGPRCSQRLGAAGCRVQAQVPDRRRMCCTLTPMILLRWTTEHGELAMELHTHWASRITTPHPPAPSRWSCLKEVRLPAWLHLWGSEQIVRKEKWTFRVRTFDGHLGWQ